MSLFDGRKNDFDGVDLSRQDIIGKNSFTSITAFAFGQSNFDDQKPRGRLYSPLHPDVGEYNVLVATPRALTSLEDAAISSGQDFLVAAKIYL